MKTTIKNYKGEQFEIVTFFDQEFKGRGGWNINCEVSFKNEKKSFDNIEESILEWCEDFNDKCYITAL